MSQELKSLKYKHMFFNSPTETNMETLEQIIQRDTDRIACLPWNKLDKSTKIKKLNEFSDRLGQEKEHSVQVIADLKAMLKDKMNRKMMQKSKDIVYDKDKGIVMDIPNLIFHSETLKYTLRTTESESPLNSLAPKNKTIKNTKTNS